MEGASVMVSDFCGGAWMAVADEEEDGSEAGRCFAFFWREHSLEDRVGNMQRRRGPNFGVWLVEEGSGGG